MIQERIDQIEATLQGATNLSPETKAELLRLLGELKTEVTPLTGMFDEDAQSIAGFTDASVREAMRSQQKPELTEAALKGLTSSVEGFEASHPNLVQIVNRIALTLSNMGI